MGERDKELEASDNPPEAAPAEEREEEGPDEQQPGEGESASESSSAEDASAEEEAPAVPAATDAPGAAGQSGKDETPAAAASPQRSAGDTNPLVSFFWMPRQLEEARRKGFDRDKPGWPYYELAREAVVGAQRLGELSEAKYGVMLLNREALALMSRAELEREGVEGETWSDFVKLEAAKPVLEKLSADERELVDQAMAPDGLERLATLPKDRQTTTGKALARVAGNLYERLEREANRVASVLYLRWAKILGVLVAVLVVVIGGYVLVKRSQTGPNLAEGAEVRLSSNSRKYGVPPERLVDGDENNRGFCTRNQKNPWVEIDLGSEKRIKQVVVHNDPNFPQRAVPLVLEISKDRREWTKIDQREDVFNVWTVPVSGKKAQYVRLKLLKKGFLHLAEVKVH